MILKSLYFEERVGGVRGKGWKAWFDLADLVYTDISVSLYVL